MPHVKPSRDFKMHAYSNQQYFRHQSSKIIKLSLYFRQPQKTYDQKFQNIFFLQKRKEKRNMPA